MFGSLHSLQPFDGEASMEVPLSKSSSLDISVSPCSHVSHHQSPQGPENTVNEFFSSVLQSTMTKEVKFTAPNEPQQLLPFTAGPTRHEVQFREICFY